MLDWIYIYKERYLKNKILKKIFYGQIQNNSFSLISGTSSNRPDMPGRQLHMQVRHCDTQSDRPELYTQQWPQISEMGDHVLIKAEKKLCFMCQAYKRRTSAGWFVYTRKKCYRCNVPLCKDGIGYNCFSVFHQLQTLKKDSFGSTTKCPIGTRDYKMFEGSPQRFVNRNTTIGSQLKMNPPFQVPLGPTQHSRGIVTLSKPENVLHSTSRPIFQNITSLQSGSQRDYSGATHDMEKFTTEKQTFTSVGHVDETFTGVRLLVDNSTDVQSNIKHNEEEKPLQGQNLYTRTQSVEKEDDDDYVYESFIS